MGPTACVGTCKDCLSNQDIFSEISEALDSQSMLEHAKIVLSNQDIFSKKLKALDSQPMLEQRLF